MKSLDVMIAIKKFIAYPVSDSVKMNSCYYITCPTGVLQSAEEYMRQNYHNSFAIDCDYASAEIALNIANRSGRLWNATSSSILVDQVINNVVRGNAFYNHFSNYGKDLMYSHMLREALGRYYL